MRRENQDASGKQPASPAGLGGDVFWLVQQSETALFLIVWPVVLCQIPWLLHTLIAGKLGCL